MNKTNGNNIFVIALTGFHAMVLWFYGPVWLRFLYGWFFVVLCGSCFLFVWFVVVRCGSVWVPVNVYGSWCSRLPRHVCTILARRSQWGWSFARMLLTVAISTAFARMLLTVAISTALSKGILICIMNTRVRTAHQPIHCSE